MRTNTGWIWFFVGAVISGCAPLPLNDASELPPKQMTYAFDVVKMITPSIASDNDPSTMRQNAYTVAPQMRVLFRYNELMGHVALIRTDDTSKVQVQFRALDDSATAASALQVCPLEHQFMMMATWQAAYNFGDGKWTREGGDYDDAGCVKGTADAKDPQNIVFDVTQWFLDYPKARGVNLGLILISSKSVRIAGNLSGSAYPRLMWEE